MTLEQAREGGKTMKSIRERLGLSMRDVERRSWEIAQQKKNREYYVSHSYLSNLEAGVFHPNLLKFHTLAVIYLLHLHEVLSLFGFTVEDAARDQTLIGLPNTNLVSGRRASSGLILVPSLLRPRASFEDTNLVSRMFESWGQIPVGLLERMDLTTSLYGYVGTRDNRLYPIIRPGSFVQIDSRQTKITTDWRTEFDRPIYFVELRYEFACSWCEHHSGQLILVPTPQSGVKTRYVRYPADAGIVGRVTAVMMPIAEMVRE